MTERPKSLFVYDQRRVAERYRRTGGFASWRKERLHETALDLLTGLTPKEGVLLELGAGTGQFTGKIIEADHFSKIQVTDGAPAMLRIAEETFREKRGMLDFGIIDFDGEWSDQFVGNEFDAVTSIMALHHAKDKKRLFEQVYAVLKANGLFVLGDHMAGGSAFEQYLFGRDRALIKLGQEDGKDAEKIAAQIELDEQRQDQEGNRCEAVEQYLAYLAACGFKDVCCPWKDFWLAVFVARKAGD